MIPRIVHITAKDFRFLPIEILQKNEQLERLNPNFEFRYYDDKKMNDWILENCDESTCEIFFKINANYGAAKADLFRYLLLYTVGGIYLDIKSSCSVPFENIVKPSDNFITSHWMKDDGTIDFNVGMHTFLLKHKLVEFQQWFIIAKPNNPILNEVIKQVILNLKKKSNALNTKFGRVGVLETTGPIIFTKVISAYKEGRDFTLVDSKKCGLLYSIYELEGKETHYKLFKTHYSQLFEPIVDGSGFSFFLGTLYNRFVRQYLLRLNLKIYKWLRNAKFINL